MVRVIKDGDIIDVEPDDRGWISVDQGLPGYDYNVLVSSTMRLVSVGRRLQILKDGWFYNEAGYPEKFMLGLAWQPFPEAYMKTKMI